jgi:hypothetical protein
MMRASSCTYLVAAARVATDARGVFRSIALTRSIATRVVARASVVVAEDADVPRANATGARARAVGTAPRLVARRVTAPLAASGGVVVVIIVGVANIVRRPFVPPSVRVCGPGRALDRSIDPSSMTRHGVAYSTTTSRVWGSTVWVIDRRTDGWGKRRRVYVYERVMRGVYRCTHKWNT